MSECAVADSSKPSTPDADVKRKFTTLLIPWSDRDETADKQAYDKLHGERTKKQPG